MRKQRASGRVQWPASCVSSTGYLNPPDREACLTIEISNLLPRHLRLMTFAVRGTFNDQGGVEPEPIYAVV